MSAGPAEVVLFHQMFCQIGPAVVAFVTQVTHVAGLCCCVLSQIVHLHGGLRSAAKVAFKLSAFQLHFGIVYLDVAFNITRSFAPVVTQMTRKRFVVRMLVSNMVVQ